MAKVWLLVLCTFSGLLAELNSDGRTGGGEDWMEPGTYFPYDSMTLVRMGYHIPDCLVKNARFMDPEYRKRNKAFKSFLDYENELDAYEGLGKIIGLPYDAKIMEVTLLASKGYPQRMLVLWMRSPWVFIRNEKRYECNDYTMGSHYIGRARVSLVNLKTNSIINTVALRVTETKYYNEKGQITEIGGSNKDCFAMPYFIGNPAQNHNNNLFRYHTMGSNKDKEQRALIMNMKDINGDGKNLEFILYDQVTCFTCMTALYGYSPKQDKIICYPVLFREVNKLGKDSIVREKKSRWVDNLFVHQPEPSGEWIYYNDYSAEGNFIELYNVSYSDSLESFTGRLELMRRR